MALEDRFWPKVDKTETCWLWTGAKATNGYGNVWTGTRTALVHRVSYEMAYGPIPKGLVLDHLCRVPACVNPDHLEAVTFVENVRRGNAGLNMRSKTKCSNGHDYSPENTRVYPRKDGGLERKCLTCKRASARETARRYREKRKVT